jgi:hypothetical protein
VAREVVAHHAVAGLGQPVDLVDLPERPRADAQEANAERPRDLLNVPQVRHQCVAARRGGGAGQAGELELAPGLDRHPLPCPLQRDHVLALARGGETAPLEPRQDRRDAVVGLVRDRRAPQPRADLLLLDADAKLRPRLGAGAKIADQIVDGERHGPRRLTIGSRLVNVRAKESV